MRLVVTVCALAAGVVACDRTEADHLPSAIPPGTSATGVSASAASRGAVRLAQYKERAEGVPCPSYAAGAEVTYSEFVFRFEPPILAIAEARLPWIQSVTERSAVAANGGRVLIVPVSIKNTAPVAKSPPQGIALVTPDGVSHGSYTYNARLWSKQQGRATFWELGQLEPDQWVKIAYVFPVPATGAEKSLLYLSRTGSVRDAQGYSHRVLYEHAVADLAAPVPGDPIRGASAIPR